MGEVWKDCIRDGTTMLVKEVVAGLKGYSKGGPKGAAEEVGKVVGRKVGELIVKGVEFAIAEHERAEAKKQERIMKSALELKSQDPSRSGVECIEQARRRAEGGRVAGELPKYM